VKAWRKMFKGYWDMCNLMMPALFPNYCQLRPYWIINVKN